MLLFAAKDVYLNNHFKQCIMHRIIYLTACVSYHSLKILPKKPLSCYSFPLMLAQLISTFKDKH